MEIHSFTILKALIFPIGFAMLVSTSACNSKSNKSATTVFEEKPVTPVVKPEIKDTIAKVTPHEESSPQTESKSLPKPTAKTCKPQFKLIGEPKANHYFYYVTGFNAGEFKCWAEIEIHGQSICKGEPCKIYYLDTPSAKFTSSPPHYIDPSVLKVQGIGQFEHTSHWWEVKGAKLWGKPGKEFVYYNTNNNAGG